VRSYVKRYIACSWVQLCPEPYSIPDENIKNNQIPVLDKVRDKVNTTQAKLGTQLYQVSRESQPEMIEAGLAPVAPDARSTLE